MTKRQMKKELDRNGWTKELCYGHRGKKVSVYRRGGQVCEVKSGKLFVCRIEFSDHDGTVKGYHDFKTGETWYSDEVIKAFTL